jgi:uncharacterized membrane protein
MLFHAVAWNKAVAEAAHVRYGLPIALPQGAAMSNWIDVSERTFLTCSPLQAYAWWRDADSLPRILTAVKSVNSVDGRHTHWKVSGLHGSVLSWDAFVTADQPGRHLSWTTVGRPPVECMLTVQFSTGYSGGCNLKVMLGYNLPAGFRSGDVPTLLGPSPHLSLATDLQRFKEMMETPVTQQQQQQQFSRAVAA